MRATSTPQAPVGDDWATEFKWDGMRLHVATDGHTVNAHSSNGHSVGDRFPELTDLGETLATAAALDGEVVVFRDGRSSFRDLQHRIHVSNPGNPLLKNYPITLVLFDLLSLDGQSMITLPYHQRRRLLDELIEPEPHWRTSPFLIDGATEMLSIAKDKDFEGVVLKRLKSTYQPGKRSKDWLKVKIRQDQEFVVGGWLSGQGSLKGKIGSLLVGVWHHDELHLAARVGSGLSDTDRELLSTMFKLREDSPFSSVPTLDRPVTWVQPTIVVQIQYAEWPIDGSLRHPTYIGHRPDVDPDEVVREISSASLDNRGESE